MTDYTVFISSSDSYADIWPVFFDMFKKFWPEFDGEIVLNTQSKVYTHEGLNITCTKVGKLPYFGQTLRAGLDKIENDNVLLIMIDYMFMGKVDNDRVNNYFQFFCEKNLDSLCLVHQNYPNTRQTNHPDLLYVVPPAPHVMFSYQIAFWNKKVLYEMALPHENPWMSEWYGSQRAEKMHIKLACPKKNIIRPFPYDLRGCLHQGKWLDNAIDFLNSIEYKFDFDKRGYYVDGYNTLLFRIKLKWKIWTTGLQGSYWDLLTRKNSDFKINK